MATTDNRQFASKISFFPSWPLFTYTTGHLYHWDGYETLDQDVSIETMNSLIGLNPSKKHTFYPSEDGESFLKWYTRPTGDDMTYTGDTESSINYPYDFCMILGHNFNEREQFIVYSGTGKSPVVNNCVNSVPDFDGWSYSEHDPSELGSFKLTFKTGNSCEIGSLLWGKKWTAPQHVNLNQSYDVSYGNKIKRTVGGKNISTLNYSGTQMWGDLHAWELLPNINKENTSGWAQEDMLGKQFDPPRGGIRTWKVSWTQMASSHAMPQNAMITNNGWQQDSTENYDLSADGASATNITRSNDFFSSVYRLTLGSHLPCVVRISESNNPDQFAVVRISDYKAIEINPKLVNICLTLTEQV